MSLLEVLIAMFVLSIGLLGVAALIPVGRLAIVETGKADRSGACGRAALGEIKVRQMLDPYPWPSWPGAYQWVLGDGSDAVATVFNTGSFTIDPLYIARHVQERRPMPVPNLGLIPRVNLRQLRTGAPTPLTLDQAERIFMWHDDLEFSLPKDIKPPPPGESHRPRVPGYVDLNANGKWDPGELPRTPEAAGNYSWLVTVMPAAAEVTLPVAERSLFSVSVVVCYRRDFSVGDRGQPNGEHTATVAFLGQGYGGGSVELTSSGPADPPLRLRENEWIMLCGPVPGRTVCKWYRVVSADSQSPTHYVSLLGPDWNTAACPKPTAVAIDHVVGVYTSTIELDRNLLWNN